MYRRSIGRLAGSRRWLVAAATLSGVVLSAATLGALSLAHTGAKQSRTSFRAAANDMAATVKLDLQHEEDLLVSVRAFIIQHPDESPSQFWRWMQVLQALRRYPELLAIGEFEVVPQNSLAKWERRVQAQPIETGVRGGTTAAPPQRRTYYCLQAATVARIPVAPGIDACAADPLLHSTIVTGTPTAYPIGVVNHNRVFGVALPVYRSVVTPATAKQRRASFVGWVGVMIVAKVLLAQALENHPNMRIVLHRGNGPALSFADGPAPEHAAALSIDLHDGTTVQIFGSVSASGIFANTTATIMLLGGAVLAFLGGILLYVLATGRSRALALVAEKTEELSFQASHDGLTSLPNRELLLERTTHALARNRREHPAAALFIDIDDFKTINDSYGHAAGDELLRTIASRLDSVVREVDTAARFGGDEFVVVLDSDENAAAPELVAERILEALRVPIDLGSDQITVSASIGIATGMRASAQDLLRDADAALYAAKAAGKNRYARYEDPIAAGA